MGEVRVCMGLKKMESGDRCVRFQGPSCGDRGRTREIEGDGGEDGC